MNKTFILLLGVVVLATGAIWYLTKGESEVTVDMAVFASTTPVTFTSEDGAQNLTASFVSDQVLVNGLGMNQVVLRQVVAASGARYENTDGSIVLWNKGNEVTLYQNGTPTFIGKDMKAVPEDAPLVSTDIPLALTATTWIWSRTTSGNSSVTVPTAVEAFTITFSPEGRLTGMTDCNRFNGNYTLTGDVLLMDSFGMTKMACEDAQEQDFVNAVIGTSTVVFTATGELHLVGTDGAGTVEFKPTVTTESGVVESETEPEFDLTDGVWLWQEATVAGQTLTPNKPGDFSLTFNDDGSVAIGTDCNNMGGKYSYAGGILTFSQIISTMMACEGSQESAFSSLLNEPLKVMFEDNTTMFLTLPNAVGKATFTLE